MSTMVQTRQQYMVFSRQDTAKQQLLRRTWSSACTSLTLSCRTTRLVLRILSLYIITQLTLWAWLWMRYWHGYLPSPDAGYDMSYGFEAADTNECAGMPCPQPPIMMLCALVCFSVVYVLHFVRKLRRVQGAGPRKVTWICKRKFPAGKGLVYNVDVVEGPSKQDVVDALPQDGTHWEVMETFPTCLVEPVPGAAQKLSDAERKAGVTWGVNAVGATHTSLTGKGVKVAVLDTGLDEQYRTHPAFAGITVIGKNFTTKDPDNWYDRRGHGTHCLGTILGRTVNGVRIGVAPGVTDVIVGKVISDTGVGDHLQLIEAIAWAFEQRADIINISLEYDWPAKVREIMKRRNVKYDAANDIVRNLHREHLNFFESVVMKDLQLAHVRLRTTPLVIAACGNGNDKRDPNNQLTVSFPGAAQGVLSVAAAGKSGKDLYLAHFCNNGATLCAPGVDVASAATGGGTAQRLKTDSGTSMAAPHAAGVAALWWQLAREQGYSPKTIASRVESSLRYTALVDGLAGSVKAGLINNGLVQAPAPPNSDGAAQQRNSCTIS